MEHQKLDAIVSKMFAEIKKLISVNTKNQNDKNMTNGNVAVCIIDENGMVFGGMYGKDKPELRQSYKATWAKASLVWLTGVKTSEYEKSGWQAGLPLTLPDGSKLFVGFSGFKGAVDLEIMVKALDKALYHN